MKGEIFDPVRWRFHAKPQSGDAAPLLVKLARRITRWTSTTDYT